MCGWFCIALLLYVHLHPKTELLTACNQFINMFDDNTTRNNILLKKYLESI